MADEPDEFDEEVDEFSDTSEDPDAAEQEFEDAPDDFEGTDESGEDGESDDAVPTGFSVDEPEDEPDQFQASDEVDDEFEDVPDQEAAEFEEQTEEEDAEAFDDSGAEFQDETAFDEQEAEFGDDGAFEDEFATERAESPGEDVPADESATDQATDFDAEQEFEGEAFDEQTSPAPEAYGDAGLEDGTDAGYEEGEIPDEAYADEDFEEPVAPQEGLEEESIHDEAATDFVLEPELEALRDPPQPEPVDTEPLPDVGPYAVPATLTTYADGEESQTYAVEANELVIGAVPEDSESEADLAASEQPDIDLSACAENAPVWEHHATLYRQNKNYTLHVTSDGATQVNDELVDLGEYVELEDGDIIVFGGRVGMRFELPPEDQRQVVDSDVGVQSEAPEEQTFGEEPAPPEDEFSDGDFGEEDFGDEDDFEEFE